MIKISSLKVTQNDIRDYMLIEDMVCYVKNGGFFNREAIDYFAKQNNKPTTPLIKISIFEDGVSYIHEGHHRVCAIVLADRDYIRDDEYEIKHWKYTDYTETNWGNNWITPFDPRIEVRIHNLGQYRNKVVEQITSVADKTKQEEIALEWSSKKLHIESRKAITIFDIVKNIKTENFTKGCIINDKM